MATWTCELCGERFTIDDANPIDHLRVMHPDQYAPLATWPDGEPVIVDTTLSPEEFQ